MYKAIGYYSKNDYMTGRSVAEVMRLLQKAYPNPKRGAMSLKGSTTKLYGEPLKIVDMTGRDRQYQF
ncbi:hypothetical protein KII94_08740 [Leuconostoc gelidum subsp. gasicomitatum]|uniref:hypothetical protein n=1 Tax=Leuconostoc gelidum group TaxID=3016637 RepID=UPI001C7D2C80|nr:MULTISPECIES: hypothetical protein [Leuconostoc gelidum group]MBZ5961349.1 hypothetical protein [Leuconostoc gasicomitatum]MBZ5984165.1 hypothetical protein [Leuconostoc gasicomitatum]MBZ5994631.1 hypothetical protein [Leuconostoc gasicomitatum]MBZ6010865.1 hypothetical protein [Leuconostoc gelidum subsp. aenigmaticum]